MGILRDEWLAQTKAAEECLSNSMQTITGDAWRAYQNVRIQRKRYDDAESTCGYVMRPVYAG
jgi:hypothetical protein